MNRRSFFKRALMAVAGVAMAQRIALEPITQYEGGIRGAIENYGYNWWEKDAGWKTVVDPYSLKKVTEDIERGFLFGDQEIIGQWQTEVLRRQSKGSPVSSLSGLMKKLKNS